MPTSRSDRVEPGHVTGTTAAPNRAPETEVGRTQDAGFQIGVRRTVSFPPDVVWSGLTSHAGLSAWFGADIRDAAGTKVPAADLLARGAQFTTVGGGEGELRSVRPTDRIRARYRPPERYAPTTVQIALVAAARGTALILHEEHLDSAHEREERRHHWRAVADILVDIIEAHAKR